MRQNSNQRRGRGRNNQNRRPGRNQSFDSNGPGVRLRGTAAQLNEKYLALARDATSAGDRVMAENYHQHADHYYRVTLALNPPQVRDEDRQPDMAEPDETPPHDARPRGDRGQMQGGQMQGGQTQDRRDNRNRRGRDRQEDGEEQAAAPAEAAAADRPAEAEAEPRGRGRRPSVRRQDSDPRRRSARRADEAVPGDEPLDRGLHRILGGGPDPAAQSRERKDADAGEPARDERVGDEAAGNGAAGDPPAAGPAAPEAAEAEAGEEAPKPRARRRKPAAEVEGTAAAEPVADAAV